MAPHGPQSFESDNGFPLALRHRGEDRSEADIISASSLSIEGLSQGVSRNPDQCLMAENLPGVW